MLLSIHVAAGGLALILGAVSLIVNKGGTIHRRSGLLFVYAMLVMGVSAAILGNVGGGLMTAYFVVTARTTVSCVSQWTRRIDVMALVMVVGLSLLTIVGGIKAFNNPGGFSTAFRFRCSSFSRPS
jgi:hypothetical protein